MGNDKAQRGRQSLWRHSRAICLTDASTLAASGGSRTSLFQSLQVKPHPEFGYRPTMGEYEVLSDMRVPSGTVRANPAMGEGGGRQFFIENYKDKLRLIREHPLGQ